MSTPSTTDRILVPLDGTGNGLNAIPWVRAIATDATELILLRAVSLTLPVGGYAAVTASAYDRLQRQAVDAAEAYLNAAAEELADVTTNVTKELRLGAAAEEILELADERQPSLILMATAGRGAAGRFFVGSVADRVARSATVPVMLVPAQEAEEPPSIHDPAPVGRVVVPFDGSDLARNAFPVAADLARRLDAPAHLTRVLPTPREMVAQQSAGDRIYQRLAQALPGLMEPAVDRAWYEGYVRSVRGALASEASKLAATGIEADSEVVIGETVPMLLEVLEPDDVVVMTSHGEGGVRRWLMGSVAEQLIHEAVAPVMLVPAPGRERLAG